MKEQIKATISAIIRQPNGTFTVCQVHNEEVTIAKGKWKDRRTGKERSIIVPTGIRLIKRRFNNIINYGRALMVAEAITRKDFKFLKGLTHV